MLIDFKEIEKANSGTGNQDEFELFARDFFENIGFEILSNPSRGADGGIDLKVKEIRKGVSGQQTEINWLVSCKHYAHSGKAINSDIESDILDRVNSNNCDGFIGFYSTLPSSGLQNKLEGISNKIEHIIYDSKRIEREIIGYGNWVNIFQRYFPVSYKKWKSIDTQKEPVKLFEYYVNSKLDEYDFRLEILKTIFSSPEFILKALYYTDNYNDFIKHRPIKYVIEDIETVLNDLHRDNFEGYEDKVKQSYTTGLDFIENEKFTEFVSKKHNIYDSGDQLIRGRSFEKNCIYYVYKNLLCVNKSADSELQKL